MWSRSSKGERAQTNAAFGIARHEAIGVVEGAIGTPRSTTFRQGRASQLTVAGETTRFSALRV